MGRQYDVEDLLNSDAADPDGEAVPAATNDEVRDGKFPMETADGTGKMGNISQIVADYLQKSAGFYTEVRPYYIVRPATGNAWTGTWELFLHGIDEGGLADAVNITIGINGVVVHTQAWTVDSGARDIEFSISTAESTALIASPPTGSYARCYVAFHDSDGNEIVIRHFSLKLLDAVPKIPEAEIPDSIARDDEVSEAIAAALAAHPGAFSDSIDLGTFENANGGAIAGHYVRRTNTLVDISYTNIANENKEAEIRGIQPGFGLVFGDKIFVIEWTNENASYRSFNGFWANGEPDTTAESAQITIKVITHELRMIRFLTAGQLKKLLPEVQRAYDKTVDIHLEERPGDFVNNADAAVAGISLIENTNANRSALDRRAFNFAGLTWQTAMVDIPNDGNEYWVVVRVAKALGNIETQFQLINDDDAEGTAHLYRSRQEDTNWRYYQVTADRESMWTLQRRATSTHTSWLGRLGGAAITQIQKAIELAIDGIRSLLLPDPSGSTAGYVPKVNAARDGYELAPDEQGSGGGLSSQQVTAIANARAAARYTDEEKTKLANAIIGSDLDPYGLGFIGVYPRYMRFDQLSENIVIAFGEVHEPYDTANLIQVVIKGVRVIRDSFTPSEKFYKFSIESAQVTNIINNTHANDEHWNCSIQLYRDNYLDESSIGYPRIIPIVINRDPAVSGADGKVLYGSAVPAGSLGKVGDTYLRTVTGAVGFYEKTAASTWTFKYELANRQTLRQTLTSAATLTWAVGSGAVADLTLGHNVTLNISGGADGETAMLRCLQDGTGSRTLTFHSSIQRGGRDAPTLNTGAGERDYLLFMKVGRNWVYLGGIADE